MLTIDFPADLKKIQEPLTKFVGFGGVTMTTVQASFGKVPVETVLDKSAVAVKVVATSDGFGARYESWHRGEENGDPVYCEVYSDSGREFHGWLDPVTRNCVQTG